MSEDPVKAAAQDVEEALVPVAHLLRALPVSVTDGLVTYCGAPFTFNGPETVPCRECGRIWEKEGFPSFYPSKDR